MSARLRRSSASAGPVCPGFSTLALAQAGDDRAFGTVVAHVSPRVESSLMRLLGSDADAASGAIQDAWAAAALRLRDFGSLEHLTRWVHYVSRCRAISALRKRHGTVTTPWMRRFKDDSPVPQVTDPERDPDLDAALERTIQGLPPNQRNVASLHYLYGQTVAEVARLVDLPVSTVKMRLHRARIEVRRSLCAH